MTDEKHSAKLARVHEALSRYRVTGSRGFALDEHAAQDLPCGLDKEDAKALLKSGIKRLSALQELLYADNTWSLLIVFQAMDAGGKDSTIKHVMSGVNPQGVTVTSFKAPGPRELAHDYLWRISQALPARGHIGIFNRSHYEDVLVTRVHPELLAGSGLPPDLTGTRHFWAMRLADIAAFESYLGRQGVRIIKFFLNISPEEQRQRLLKRLDTPEKTWKFDPSDLRERAHWAEYQAAYQAAIAATATDAAPWYVVPADHKWYTRLVVAEAIIEALQSLHLRAPETPNDERDALRTARTALDREEPSSA